MFDTPLRVEHEQLGADTGLEGAERLRCQGVQPRQPVLAGDREHAAVAEHGHRPTAGKGALLAER